MIILLMQYIFKLQITNIFVDQMKFIAILLCLFLVGCGCNERQEKIKFQNRNIILKNKQFFSQTFELRKIQTTSFIESKSETTISGGFFLFVGDIKGSSKSFSQLEIKVTFACKFTNNEYRFFTIPLSQIRIKIDNNIKIPTVSFDATPKIRYRNEWKIIEEDWWPLEDKIYSDEPHVYSVLLTIKDDQWPEDFSDLPLNKEIK